MTLEEAARSLSKHLNRYSQPHQPLATVGVGLAVIHVYMHCSRREFNAANWANSPMVWEGHDVVWRWNVGRAVAL